jgi:ATP-dependent HslUV protease ATP-binding subunit HslU
MEIAVSLVREKLRKEVRRKAKEKAESRVLDALVGQAASQETRDKFKKMLVDGKLDEKEIDIDVQDVSTPGMANFDIPGGQMGVINIGEILGKAMGGRIKTKQMPVKDAFKVLLAEEGDKLIDEDRIIKESILLAENESIVFLDEMDKIAVRVEARGSDVSREGVQRDLLPLLEGTTVATKYGPVKTDHILFICSGAFHMAKPSDLLPELQGRLPIRVELKALKQKDLVRILKEPEASLLKQYHALLETEGVEVTFKEEGILAIATIAAEVNESIENIGARRLHTILEKLMEDISFRAGDGTITSVSIDSAYVDEHLKDLSKDRDLSRFIL